MEINKININPKLIPNKLPLENIEPSEEELRYYLSNWEYNELLTAILELINDYNEKLASGWEGGGTGGITSIIKSTDDTEASDTTVYSSLRSKKDFAVGSGLIDFENPNNTSKYYRLLKSSDLNQYNDIPTDTNVFTSLRVLNELQKLKQWVENMGPELYEEYYLSKIYPDTAKGEITFEKGIKFTPKNSEDLDGTIRSFIINEHGRGHLRSLKLEEWLEVPELRYNRIEVNIGDAWRAPGGGIIEHVEELSATEGIITLKLEEGELGAISINDICMGIYHFMGDGSGNNSEEDHDDYGDRTMKGFATSYFTPIEILDGENSRFRYKLRDVSRHEYLRTIHPQPFMHFVSYGNFTNKDRQTSSYQTRTYHRYLTGINTWNYGKDNIAAQFGDLSNLYFLEGREGYSIYLTNVYFSGNLEQIKSVTLEARLSNPEIPVTFSDEGVPDLTNSRTHLNVYEGEDELQYDPDPEGVLSNGSYRVTVEGKNITPGNIETIYEAPNRSMGIGNSKNMLKDSASIMFEVVGKRLSGKQFTIVKYQQLYKVVNGEDGEDGISTKRIYTRTKAESAVPTRPTDENLLPDAEIKWFEEAQGVNNVYKFEWASEKTRYGAGGWGRYTGPSLWATYSYDGQDGIDGKDVEFVFNRSSSRDKKPPLIDVVDRTIPENYPGGISDLGQAWSDEPSGVNKENPVEWVSKRVTKVVERNGKNVREWDDYGDPSEWANYSFDGARGPKGEPGEQGPRGIQGISGIGVPIVFRGPFIYDDYYYGSDIRMDVVYHDNKYWRANNVGGEFRRNTPSSSSSHWSSFGGNFESVATGLLLSERANIANFSFVDGVMMSQAGVIMLPDGTIQREANLAEDIQNENFTSNLVLNGNTGQINALKGSIGGFNIVNDTIQSVLKEVGGSPTISMNSFTGEFKATKVNLKGTINAIGGNIGGFIIDEDKLQSTHGTTPSILLNGITGAGHLAGGNISWDSNGEVTFGSNVTLNWSKITGAPTIPDGVDDDHIKDLIDDEFIKGIFKEAIETDFTTKITSEYITTEHINTLGLTSLGEVAVGSFRLGNGNFVVNEEGDLTAKNADIEGKITATSGSFKGKIVSKDALIEGALTTPFRDGFFRLTEDGSPIEVSTNGLQNNNCVVITGTDATWTNTFVVPFSSEYNGFRATIINTDWGSDISRGAISASAPNGKYFQERGEYLSKLIIGAYEGVEMIGVGKDSVFYGWLILNRFRFGKNKVGDGFNLNAVATGYVSSSESSANIVKQRTYDGRKCTVQKGSSYVDIKLPSGMFTTPNNHNVILSLKSGDEGVTIRHSSIDSDTIRVHCCSPYLRLLQGNQTLEYHTVFCDFTYTIMTSHLWT